MTQMDLHPDFEKRWTWPPVEHWLHTLDRRLGIYGDHYEPIYDQDQPCIDCMLDKIEWKQIIQNCKMRPSEYYPNITELLTLFLLAGLDPLDLKTWLSCEVFAYREDGTPLVVPPHQIPSLIRSAKSRYDWLIWEQKEYYRIVQKWHDFPGLYPATMSDLA